MKIADFFGEVKLKIDTTDIKKLGKALDEVSKKATGIGQKLQTALNPNLTGKAPRTPRTPVTKGFDTDKFMDKVGTQRAIRQMNKNERLELGKKIASIKKEGLSTNATTAKIQTYISATLKASRANARQAKSSGRLKNIMDKSSQSLNNLAASYASVFAVLAGSNAIKKAGQDIQSGQAALLAVTDGSVQAGEAFEYVRAESLRMGLSIGKSSIDFAKLKSVQGTLSDTDVQGIFTGIAEAATVSQLSMDDTQGSLRAVVQMMAKGKVNMEDFRQQIAERMPAALKAMQNAAGAATEGELFAMIESGSLGKETIAKFGIELSNFAKTNGALAKSLETNKKQQDKLNTSFEVYKNLIFTSGFEEGLTSLFKSIRQFMEANQGFAESLGGVFKVVLYLASSLVDVLAPVFGIISKGLEILNSATGNWGGGLLLVSGYVAFMVSKVGKLVEVLPKLKTGFLKVATSMNPMLLKFTLIAAAIIAVVQAVRYLHSAFTGEAMKPLTEVLGLSSVAGATQTEAKNNSNRFSNLTGDSQASNGTNMYIDRVEVNNHSDRLSADSIMQESMASVTV